MGDQVSVRQGEALLTVAQVSRLLHVHPNSVRRWANLGLLRAYRLGPRGDRRFHPDDVRRFLESWDTVQHKLGAMSQGSEGP